MYIASLIQKWYKNNIVSAKLNLDYILYKCMSNLNYIKNDN